MKFRKNKKGFTIVELIIVIAVIGILAAVMVPTIIHLVGKANKASDDSLVSNLNKALAIRESETSKKPVTMHEAVESLEVYGYKLDALVARSDESLLYDLKENKFLLTGDADSAKAADYWKIQDTVYNNNEYNIYASSKFSLSEIKDLDVGFDAGFKTDITSIEFKTNESKTAIIRTDSDNVVISIDAKNSEVKHFGLAKEVNVIRVKKGTYSEQGTVLGNINLAQGKVEVAEGASCSNVVIKELPSLTEGEDPVTPTQSGVEVAVVSGAEVNTVISSSEDVSIAQVVSGDGANEVAKIEANDDNVAYVEKVGYESFADALAQAKDKVLTLTKDASFASASFYDTLLTNGGSFTLDLNEHTLTQSDNSGFKVSNGTKLVVKNGEYVANNMNSGTSALFSVESSSKVTFNSAVITTNGTALYPRGDASEVNVLNSTIVAGTYCVGTNANSPENYNPVIKISNSDLSVLGYMNEDGDDCAVLINVPCKLEISDSSLRGHRQVLAVRAGSAVVKNSTLTQEYGELSFIDYTDRKWKSGNEIPHYAVVIGSHEVEGATKATYKANASVSFENVKVISDANTTVYMDANAFYTSSLNYDSASSVGSIVKCEGHESRISVNA